jgi:hypothetical protein
MKQSGLRLVCRSVMTWPGKQQRKDEAIARIEAEKNAYTVAQLADEYFERMIAGRWRHPNMVRARIEKEIKPAIGSLKVEDVKPHHIDDILKTVLKRGAPSISNDVLRWLKRIFNYAVKRHAIEFQPPAIARAMLDCYQ